MHAISNQHHVMHSGKFFDCRTHATRVGCRDGDHAIAEFCFQSIRLIAEQQTSLMHERDAMAALGLIEIRSRGKDGHSLFKQRVEYLPEIAARNRVYAIGWLIEQKVRNCSMSAACSRRPLRSLQRARVTP